MELHLIGKAFGLYLLCPCQPALHGDGFDKKAQHGLMCLFQSYCQCEQSAVQTHGGGGAEKRQRRMEGGKVLSAPKLS